MDPKLEERLTAIETKLTGIERTVIKIRKVQRTTNTARALYWGFIILLGFGAFYFVKPYLEQLKNVYSSVGEFSTFDSQKIDELIKQFSGPDN